MTVLFGLYAMKRIPLSQGKYALVDDADYERLNQWKWCVSNEYGKLYAVCWQNDQHVRMHRFLLGLKKGNAVQVDHKDGNGLNNQRSNLRIATHKQNQWNKRKRRDNTSGYKGVFWHEASKKWLVQIKANGKIQYIGCFKSKIEAARKYNEAAKKYHGKFASLNNITN
jgi:hypothetical protein